YLARVLFPAGVYAKQKIRDIAREFKLPNAGRPDSQGLCFVGDVSMRDFLSRFITLQKGVLLDGINKQIGEHDGAELYTIGQRHGFRLSPGTPEGPYYVTYIDTEKNTVFVSKERTATAHLQAKLSDVHWLHGSTSEVESVTRSHAKPVNAQIVGEHVS